MTGKFWRSLRVVLAVALWLGGCAEAPPPRKVAPLVPPPELRTLKEQALERALGDFYGAPYRAGGTTPGGVDCSGLIQAVFQRVGVILPRTVAQQYAQGQTVGPGELRFGDVVFFNRFCQVRGSGRRYFLAGMLPAFGADQACHNGIYLGQGRFVHASPKGVFVSRLDAEVWRASYLGARRFLPASH
jgi:cell wall-associated NlpC family hydrolase